MQRRLQLRRFCFDNGLPVDTHVTLGEIPGDVDLQYTTGLVTDSEVNHSESFSCRAFTVDGENESGGHTIYGAKGVDGVLYERDVGGGGEVWGGADGGAR